MGFHVQVCFTGICQFIKDSSSNKICAVIVNCDPIKTPRAPGGTILRRHRGFVRFPMNWLKSAQDAPADAQVLWYLDKRWRITFKSEPENEFIIDARFTTAVPSMEKMAGSYADAYDGIVGPNPPDIVQGQVLINQGNLSVNPELSSFVVLNSLNGQAKVSPESFTQEVFLTFSNLEEFALVAEEIGGTRRLQLDFFGRDGDPMKLTVANLCEENPLQWPIDNRQDRDDIDFMWYYMLLSEATREKLDKEIAVGAPLPHPLIPRDKQGAAEGMNCLCSIGKPRPLEI